MHSAKTQISCNLSLCELCEYKEGFQGTMAGLFLYRKLAKLEK